MSDAIKVLKKFVKDCNECCADDISYRQPVEDAINEAIIALEQKERLEDWLKNKISLCNKTNKFYDLKKADYYSARIKTLKEVLKKLEGVSE